MKRMTRQASLPHSEARRMFSRLHLERNQDTARPLEITLSFSSEFEGERSFGLERLDHSANAVDLSRLNDGAPLLFNHDANRHLGSVVEAWVGNDRRGYARVRFNDNAEGRDFHARVMAETLTGVSVGYTVQNAEELDGRRGLNVTRWQPFELSLVTVPFDVGVGTNRNQTMEPPMPNPTTSRRRAASEATENQDNQQPIEDEEEEQRVEAQAPEEDDGEDEGAPQQEQRMQRRLGTQRRSGMPSRAGQGQQTQARAGVTQERQAEIRLYQRIAEMAGLRGQAIMDIALDARSERDARTLTRQALQKQSERSAALWDPFGGNEREASRYSLVRLARHQLFGEEAGLELEAHRELARHFGGGNGHRVPFGVLTRELNTYTQTGGAELIPTNMQGFIEPLRNTLPILQAGASVWNGLSGMIEVPGMNDAFNFSFGTEGTTRTPTTPVTFKESIQPREAYGTMEITRSMLQNSSVALEQKLQQDVMHQLARTQQWYALFGDGAGNSPTGLFNTAGTIPGSMATPSWQSVVAMQASIDAGDVPDTKRGWITSSLGAAQLQATPREAGTGVYLWGDDNKMARHPGFDTQMIADDLTAGTTHLLYGAWNHLVIALFGSFDARFSNAKQLNRYELEAVFEMDVLVERPQAFAIADDLPVLVA